MNDKDTDRHIDAIVQKFFREGIPKRPVSETNTDQMPPRPDYSRVKDKKTFRRRGVIKRTSCLKISKQIDFMKKQKLGWLIKEIEEKNFVFFYHDIHLESVINNRVRNFLYHLYVRGIFCFFRRCLTWDEATSNLTNLSSSILDFQNEIDKYPEYVNEKGNTDYCGAFYDIYTGDEYFNQDKFDKLKIIFRKLLDDIKIVFMVFLYTNSDIEEKEID